MPTAKENNKNEREKNSFATHFHCKRKQFRFHFSTWRIWPFVRWHQFVPNEWKYSKYLYSDGNSIRSLSSAVLRLTYKRVNFLENDRPQSRHFTKNMKKKRATLTQGKKHRLVKIIFHNVIEFNFKPNPTIITLLHSFNYVFYASTSLRQQFRRSSPPALCHFRDSRPLVIHRPSTALNSLALSCSTFNRRHTEVFLRLLLFDNTRLKNAKKLIWRDWISSTRLQSSCA